MKKDQKIFSYLVENPTITKKVINNLISDKRYLLNYDLISKEELKDNKEMYLNLIKSNNFELKNDFDDKADCFAVSEFEIISLSSEEIYYKNILFYNFDLICEVLKNYKYYLYYYLGDDVDPDFVEKCRNL